MAIPTSHSTDLYTLGKGILSIAEFSGGVPGVYYDVGNCPSFTVEPTEETLEHFSQRSGTRTKDKEVTIESGYTVEFELDEVSVRNMKMFLRGTTSLGHIIYMNKSLDTEYALKFVSDNPAGSNAIYYFWRVKLTPNGAFNLISDEWSVMSFSGEGLSDITNHPESEFSTIHFITTTSTTTSTSTTTTS